VAAWAKPRAVDAILALSGWTRGQARAFGRVAAVPVQAPLEETADHFGEAKALRVVTTGGAPRSIVRATARGHPGGPAWPSE